LPGIGERFTKIAETFTNVGASENEIAMAPAHFGETFTDPSKSFTEIGVSFCDFGATSHHVGKSFAAVGKSFTDVGVKSLVRRPASTCPKFRRTAG
jgi:hypothetical protein